MKSQAKVKFIISLAIFVIIAMFCVIGYQLINISKVKKLIAQQQQQIASLQDKIDSYEKSPNEDYDNITGE